MNTYNSIVKSMNTEKERFHNCETPLVSSSIIFFIIDVFIFTWLITDRNVERQKAGLYIWTTQLFILNLSNILICLGASPLLMVNFCVIFPEFYYSLDFSGLELEIMFTVNFLLLFLTVLLAKY